MMEGINSQVNTRANMPVGGNEETRGDEIWKLAHRNNMKLRNVSRDKIKGTYRPLPLV